MNSYESFKKPDIIYHGTDFWMLNDRLEENELVRQMHEMKTQGVYSFIARTYIGLKSDYPGKDFKSKLKLIVKTAKELDMKVFLQAGYMPEHVLNLPKKYSLSYIKLYRDAEPENNEEVLCKFGDVTFTKYSSGTFLDMFNHDSVEFYLNESYGNMWTDFEDEYGKTILSIWVDEPSYSSDYFPYPDGIEEAFEKRWGYSLKDNIYKLYFDEDGYRSVRYHYRILLQEMLENNYFRMLREWCNSHGLLASGHLMLEDTLELQITRACAAMPYYKYFDIPGIDLLCGQMNWRSGEIKSEFKYTYRPTITTTPIQCASAARQCGSKHILCEMYGVTSQDMTFRNQKHQFDYMAAHGINHRSVHGIFYSLHGRAKRMYPPHVNYYQPYWDELHQLYDYVASASRFISLGKPDEDVLVIHPLDSAYCDYVSTWADKDASKRASYRELKKRDTYFHNLIVSLSLAHCVFDLGDEKTILDMGSVDGNSFVIGKMRYSTVVLPELIALRSTTLEKLKVFANNGGRIIVTGRKPYLLDGYETDGDIMADIPNVICTEDVNSLIPLIENKNYSLKGHYFDKNIFVRRRTEGDDGYYFIFNADCSGKKNTVLSVKGNVKAELWDGFSKEITELSCRYTGEYTEIELCIPEGGSLMVHTVKAEEKPATAEKKLCGKRIFELGDDWSLERKQQNVLLLEFCKLKKADGDYTDEYPILAVQQMLVDEDYHGEITLKYTFKTDKVLSGLSLALEDASKHRIFFNGKEISSEPNGYYFARSFETVALPDSVCGENIVELKREFVPLEKMKSKIGSLFEERKGVELEFAYLLGDFALYASAEPERNGNLRYNRNMSLTSESGKVLGELTKEGYPFYAGTIALTKEFDVNYNGNDASLTLDELDGCLVKVILNGKDCGYMHCPPYRLDISEALKDGKNTVTLELTNTLRNLLGPYHRPEGEIGRIGGGYGFPDYSWIGVIGAEDKNWYNNRVPDTKRWTDSYMCVALGVQGAKIETE